VRDGLKTWTGNYRIRQAVIGRTDDGKNQHVVAEIIHPCLLTNTSKRSRVGCVPMAQRSPPRDIRDLTTLVGYRSQFRLRWMATRLNLFTIVGTVPLVTFAGLERFTNDAIDYAISQKGRFHRLQSGVAVIPVLVGERVESGAAAFATDTLVLPWGAIGWPTTVDMTSRHVYQHEGRVIFGGLYASWLRQQIAIALPDPITA
jgi:hypothetical protein